MAAPFEIAFEGRVAVDQIDFQKIQAPALPKALQAVVDERWQHVLRWNPSAFDGPNISIREIIPRGKGVGPDKTYTHAGLTLRYWPTTYSVFCGTTVPEVRHLYGNWAVHTGSAVCAVILSADGYVVLHLRGRDVAYRRHLHMPGGILAHPDPVSAIKQELEEELGIGCEECPMPTLLGIAKDLTPGRWNHEFCFLIEVPLTFSEINRRHKGARDKNEGVLIPLPATKEHLTGILELGGELARGVWVPTGMAALILYGRSMGWEWHYSKLLGRLI